MTEASRRAFLFGAGAAGLLIAGCAKTAAGEASSPASGRDQDDDDDVAPPEDLMREHGVLNRILLIYEEGARRLDELQPLVIDVVAKSADIVQRFVEDYHEKLEEEFLFPRFEAANQLVELVSTLRRQHLAGRALTETILRLSTAPAAQKDDDRRLLIATLRSFVRMYRPHEAREDTVLFPAFRTLVGKTELHDLGAQFEDKEHQLFGKDGFEGVVARVAVLEQALGTYDLNQFTPSP